MITEPKNLATVLIKGVVATAYINQHNSSIHLMSESGCDEGGYYPAQDVQVYGDKNLLALRDFINKVLEERKAYLQ